MPFKELWTPAYRSRTILLTVFQILQTIGFYGFANWAPTYLLHSGRGLGQSLNFGFIFALMNPVGPIIGMLTTERIERKHALVMLSIFMATTGMVFAFTKNAIAVIVIGALLTVFGSWFASIFHAYQAELFPTRARATGVGFTYGWSRVSAVFSTLIIGALLAHGILAVFLFIGGAMLLAALIVGIWGPKANHVALEQISH
jgi:putative MFS transporter